MPKKKTIAWRPVAEVWLWTRFKSHSHAQHGTLKQLMRHLQDHGLQPEHANPQLLKDFVTYRHRKWRQMEKAQELTCRRTRSGSSPSQHLHPE